MTRNQRLALGGGVIVVVAVVLWLTVAPPNDVVTVDLSVQATDGGCTVTVGQDRVNIWVDKPGNSGKKQRVKWKLAQTPPNKQYYLEIDHQSGTIDRIGPNQPIRCNGNQTVSRKTNIDPPTGQDSVDWYYKVHAWECENGKPEEPKCTKDPLVVINR